MAIAFALVSALAYGISDFVGGLLSRRLSPWAVAAVAQVSVAASTLVVAGTVPGTPRAVDFAWAVVAAVGSGSGVGFLYRGFATGRMGVVGPVSAVGAAVVPVLVGGLTGERPAWLVWLGVLLALPGIWLVASEPAADPAVEPAGRSDADRTSRRTPAAGFVDGVLAGLGFGVLFAALGQIPDGSGLWPLALAQLVSVPVVVLAAVLLGGAWRPRERRVGWAVLLGPLGAGAAWAFLLSTQRGFLVVAGVLASLYPAVTVLLATLLLREPIHRVQGVGLAVSAVAVVLVATG